MEIKNITIDNPLKLAWATLPVRFPDWIERRDNIIKECEISRATFYAWILNPDRVKKQNRIIISKFLEVPLEELFPENGDGDLK